MTERYSKYWICPECAKVQGLITPEHSVTCIFGRCAHCESTDEMVLTPVCDYADPKSGREAVWD